MIRCSSLYRPSQPICHPLAQPRAPLCDLSKSKPQRQDKPRVNDHAVLFTGPSITDLTRFDANGVEWTESKGLWCPTAGHKRRWRLLHALMHARRSNRYPIAGCDDDTVDPDSTSLKSDQSIRLSDACNRAHIASMLLLD